MQKPLFHCCLELLLQEFIYWGENIAVKLCGLCFHQTSKYQKIYSNQVGGVWGEQLDTSHCCKRPQMCLELIIRLLLVPSGNQVIKVQVCSTNQCPPAPSLAPQEFYRCEEPLLGFLESLVLWK